MRRYAGLLAIAGALLFVSAAQAAPPASAGSFVLTANSPGGTYAPTFTGNGMLGVRVPPSGQGYAGGTVPAQSELAGFYGQVTNDPKPANDVQQRANIPTWSTLTFSENGNTFTVPGPGVSNWRQSIDLHTGIVTTTARWTAPDGHVTDLTYEVLTDRANPRARGRPAHVHAALVRRRDGHRRDRRHRRHHRHARAHHPDRQGLERGRAAGLADGRDQGHGDPGDAGKPAAGQPQHPAHDHADRPDDRSERRPAARVPGAVGPDLHGHQVRRRRELPEHGRHHHRRPGTGGVRGRRRLGRAAGRRTRARGRRCGAGWIEVRGNRTLATDVNASEFYLWSSTRDGVDWSVSPAGLSSNGYDGHIFWDAETWMYPSLLAQHPDLAAGMDAYRFQRLTEAEQHATATGYAGARFPWESALDGTEQIPPPTSVNSEGLYEQHITADIALAQWQYYLVTANKTWLRQQGWPVLSGAAAFWASRATARQRRQVPHRRRHRARRGEPGRQRRGLHERRRDAHAPGRGRGRPGARDHAACELVADRRRPGRAGRHRAGHPPRVLRIRRPARQAGRRHAAPVPVGLRDAAKARRAATSTTTCRAPIRAARR